MNCPRCSAPYLDVAHFCAVCGADVLATGAAGQARSRVYAVHPGEPLLSFDLVTSLLPLASASAPQTYKFALAIGLFVPALAAMLGLLPLAVAAAAVLVPVVYVLYLYDVNEWDDEPVPVLLATVGLAGVLAYAFTLFWHGTLLDGAVTFLARDQGAHVDVTTLLVVGLLVPVVGEALKEIGPLWLASRPRYDDLLDGVTFGVTAGASFAAVETLVIHRELLLGGQTHFADANPALWLAVVVTAGLVKPVVYGAASGIAVGAWSGLGEGYDGFGPAYLRGLGEALLANIAFQTGIYLTGVAGGTTGVVLGLAWGLLVAAVLVVRLRYVLHVALLEGALEHARNGTVPVTAARDEAYCAECEMPLLHEASFCVACGAGVRAASKPARRANAAPATDADASPAAPAPGRHRGVLVVVGAVVCVALVALVVALVNASKDAGAAPDVAEVADPGDIDASGGPAAVPPPPVTLPGPQPPPSVITTTTPTTAASTTTTAPALPAAGSVVVSGSVSVTPAPGWDTTVTDDGLVQLDTDGAVFTVTAGPTDVDAQGLLGEWLAAQADQMPGFELVSSEAAPLPSAAVVSAQAAVYEALLVSHDGSVAVEATVVAWVTVDGVGVVTETLNERGRFDAYVDDYAAMRASIASSLR